jgi:hypothetical protein
MTTALEGGGVQSHTPTALYPRERPDTHCTGDWVGPRAGLDRCGKSCLHRDSITGPSNPYPVAIPTEVPGPHNIKLLQGIKSVVVIKVCLLPHKSSVLCGVKFQSVISNLSPYFSIDNVHLIYNAHPNFFRHSFCCIDKA